MELPNHQELEHMLRRVVRQELRAALDKLVPVDVLLLTYREAAEWWNEQRGPEDKRRPLTARDVRGFVDLGFVRAVHYKGKEQISLAELEWHKKWMRHTWEERESDRLANDQAENERRRLAKEAAREAAKIRKNERRAQQKAERRRRARLAGHGDS